MGLDIIVDDIGSMSDEKLLLSTRSYTFDNTFNFQYGLGYHHYKANLGPSFVQTDLLDVKILSAMWGVGNKWTIEEQFEITVDWFRIFIPIKTLSEDDSALNNVSSNDDREDLKKLINLLNRIPTFTLIHFEIGYRF